MSTKDNPISYLEPKEVYIPIFMGPTKLNQVVNIGEHVFIGSKILERNDHFYVPVFSPISGTIKEIKKMWHHSGRMVETLVIENDFKEEVLSSLKPYDEKTLDRATMIEIIKNNGVIGLGGAGFPCYIKCDGALKDTLIINAIECEPYLTCDYENMLHNINKLIHGSKLLMLASGAKKCVIALKEYRKDLISRLEDLIKDCEGFSLFISKDIYPAGWEKYLVEHIMHKKYERLPGEVGAIVNNASTAMLISDIVKTGLPLDKRYVTVTGEGIKEPKNYLVKIGTRILELVEKSGGYTIDPNEAYMVAGGPMTGHAMLMDDMIVDQTTSAVIIKKAFKDLTPSCLGCGKCAENCPAHLTPTAIRDAFLAKDGDLIKALNINACVLCGLCSYVCPSRTEITDFMSQAKAFIRK